RSAAGVALDLAERGTMFAETTSLWALGLLELALDRPADAHQRLGPLVERVEAAGIGEPGSIRFVTDDVEALVGLGELGAAATQRRVAELVAEGRTNREVAAALHVTPRTVEGTLSRVYAKLGVRSRTELARRWTLGS